MILSAGQQQRVLMLEFKLATKKDIDQIIPLCQNFHKASPYKDYDFDIPKVQKVIKDLLLDPTRATIILAVNSGTVIGVIGGAATELLLSQELICTELMWWVEEEYRGTTIGFQLLEAYEYWAKNIARAKIIQVAALDTKHSSQLETYYKSKGYKLSEKAFIKEID